jgi:hypothetical protein
MSSAVGGSSALRAQLPWLNLSIMVHVRNVFCLKGGAPPKAEGLTSWCIGMVCRTMLSFSAG